MIKNNLNNKKIVMLVVNDFSYDSRVLKEAKSAQKAGMKVWVICRKSSATKFKEEKENIKIIRVQSFLDKIWSKYNKNSGEVAGSQSRGAPKSLITYAALLNTWLINKLFINEVLQINPDIIHANDSVTLPAAVEFKKRGYRVIYDAHEFYSESLDKPNPIWKSFFVHFEKKLNNLDGIFSVNQSMLDEFDRRYKTEHIPKVILYNTPSYQKNNLIHRQKTRLLYLGHYMPRRGIEQLFQAVEKISNVTLTVYGNGFLKNQNPNIIIRQPVPPDQVVKEAKKYDIGVLPYIGTNLNHLYSTPNKLFEYIMAGLAVVASDLPEIRKVIEKAQNGILFNPENPDDITSKINLLLKNPQKIREYRKNSLKFAREYSWEKQEKKQLGLYEKIITEPCGKRIFVGPLDLGLNHIFKETMAKQGFYVTTCSFVEHGNFGWKNDIELRINKTSWPQAIGRVIVNFFRSLDYNIYHFKFGQSLLPWNLDLPFLKILNKKIIMNFHGLDIRQLDRFQKNKYNKMMVQTIGYSWIKELKKRMRYFWIKNWVDKIVVSTPDLLEFASEAEFIPEMADINKFKTQNSKLKANGKIIYILHAPSHRGIKGTEFIIEAVKKIREEKYPIKLLLAENIPAAKMGEYFQKADIVIDQLLIGSYGVVSIEGMLASKPVLCYIRNDLRRFYPKKLPIFSINPETCEIILRTIINDRNRINKIGKLSFKYVKKYHHPESIGEKWKKLYQSL